MATKDLSDAKNAKKDEFYTQYEDIQAEVNAYLEYDPNVFRNKTILLPCDDPEWSNFTRFFAQNFENFGLKKLISTSYAVDSKPEEIPYQLTLFEKEAPQFDSQKSRSKGKIFTLTRRKNKKIDINDLKWRYLDGDGDFRSSEVSLLRDEADIIVTNPPFSLFQEFIDWIMMANKKFLIIGNQNAVTLKQFFPLLKENKVWFGESIHSGDREFRVPDTYPLHAAGWRVDEEGNKYIRVKGVRWFTNLDHGRRHQPLSLMTMEDNIKFSRHKEVRGIGYPRYVNYDAIEVPYTDAIPSDYDGEMGVPITFLDKYNPEQFEIVGSSRWLGRPMSEVAPKGSYVSGGVRFYLPVENLECSQSVNVERERESGIAANGGTPGRSLSTDASMTESSLNVVQYKRLYDRIVIKRRQRV